MVHAAVSAVREASPGVLSREALVYGAKELARRAGVSEELFSTWSLRFDSFGGLALLLDPSGRKQLRFPAVSAKGWEEIANGNIATVASEWAIAPSSEIKRKIPRFWVPFANDQSSRILPLFSVTDRETIDFTQNLAASAVLTLSRFEETLSTARDMHGRFRTASGVAWRGGFHERPVVDEWGLAFAQALKILLPSWVPANSEFRVMLGHDVDEIGLPFNFRSTVAHTLRRGRPLATIRDLLAPVVFADTTYLKLLHSLVSLSKENGFSSTVYWKSSKAGLHDTGYDLRDPKLRGAFRKLRKNGAFLGVHPGYETYLNRNRFMEEVESVVRILGTRNIGGRQDFLRWNPSTWSWWESAGLAYDASVGFADSVGFRAGTCHPYYPWLFQENRPARLLEVPMTAMDSALRGYMELPSDSALNLLRSLAKRCRLVGGVFHLVWHSTTMADAPYAAAYKALLKELAGAQSYDPLRGHAKNIQ